MIFNKWKEEWIKKHKSKIEFEYYKELKRIKDSYVNDIKEAQESLNIRKEKREKEIDDIEKSLEYKKKDLEDLLLRQKDKETELKKVNDNLRDQIRLIEAKASPSSVWESAFSSGFSSGFNMAIRSVTQIDDSVKKAIKRKSIDEAIRRMNGNKLQKNSL